MDCDVGIVGQYSLDCIGLFFTLMVLSSHGKSAVKVAVISCFSDVIARWSVSCSYTIICCLIILSLLFNLCITRCVRYYCHSLVSFDGSLLNTRRIQKSSLSPDDLQPNTSKDTMYIDLILPIHLHPSLLSRLIELE